MRGHFKKSVINSFQNSTEEGLHPFKKMINHLLEKGIITTKDNMTTLAQKIIENKHLLNNKSVTLIFSAAESAGLLTASVNEFRKVLEAARLEFTEIVQQNKQSQNKSDPSSARNVTP
jgi:predicted transcriptional regulator